MKRILTLWGAALTLCLSVYRPDRDRPFDILDFGEIIPIMRGASSFSAQFTDLAHYGVEQAARANLVAYGSVVVRWRLFGSWTPGWQIWSALVMVAVVLLMYVLLRRLGATRLGASIGGSTFLFAPAAASGWIRLTMGEPLGLLVVLLLSILGTRFQTCPRWHWHVLLFAVGTVTVILTKELMAPTLLLPLAIAVALGADGRFSASLLNRRSMVLISAAGIASLATLMPLWRLVAHAKSSAFGSLWGTSTQPLGGIIGIWLETLVPFELFPRTPSVIWSVAFGGMVFLVATGWRLGLRDEDERSRAQILLAIALLFPLVGAISYAPWPRYTLRYAFPYLTGSAIRIGTAVTFLERHTKFGVTFALGISLVSTLFAASGAAGLASRTEAVQQVNNSVVGIVAGRPRIDSVFVSAGRPEPHQEWQGLGPTLYRFGVATDRKWPPTIDVSCEDAESRRKTTTSTIVVVYSSICGATAPGTHAAVRRYRRIDWTRWRFVEDSIRADITIPNAVATAREP